MAQPNPSNSRRPSPPGAARSGTPPVLPAGAFTPARPPRNAGLHTGIARSAGETPVAPPHLALQDQERRQSSRRGPSHRHARPGTPVFRPASPAPRAKLPSPLPPVWRSRTPVTPVAPPGLALPDQERRQSSRRGPSHRHARPGTPVFRPASPAPRAKLPSPLPPVWRSRTPVTPIAPPPRMAQPNPSNSHRPSRPGAAGSGTPPVLPAGPFTPARPPGTPVFRPASSAPRAKRPSPLPAWRCRIRNAASPPGGALHTGTPAQERRSSDRHRPLRGRNSHRPSRPGAAGPQAPPVLPAGAFTPARPPRNAGLHTGIARSAGETPIAPPGLALPDQERRQSSRRGPSHRHARQERRSSDRHRPLRGRNSHRPSRPGAAGSGTPPVLPAGPFTPARPPRNAGLQTGIARSAGETPIAPPRMAPHKINSHRPRTRNFRRPSPCP